MSSFFLGNSWSLVMVKHQSRRRLLAELAGRLSKSTSDSVNGWKQLRIPKKNIIFCKKHDPEINIFWNLMHFHPHDNYPLIKRKRHGSFLLASKKIVFIFVCPSLSSPSLATVVNSATYISVGKASFF